MDWSYELLSENERDLLNQLSVFTGDFSLEAVESICSINEGSAAHTIDLLIALVDNSIVTISEERTETRYQLLETVRQYALEKLQAAGGLREAQDRHLAFYVKLAEEGFPHVWVGRTHWMDRFETEHDNFRSAMEHAISTNLESAIRIGKSLDMFWDLTHRGKESYIWGMQILELTKNWQPNKWRALALGVAGARTWSGTGNFPESLKLLEAGLEMARKVSNKHDLMFILQGLAAVSWFAGNHEQMRNYAGEYLMIAQDLDDKNNIRIALWQLGAAACGLGDIDLGRSYYEQALKLAQEENSPLDATSALRELALIAHREGNYAQAKVLYQKGIQASKDARWETHTVTLTIKLVQIALCTGDPILAKSLCKEGLALWRKSNSTEENPDILACFSGLTGITGQEKLSAKLFGAVDTAYNNSPAWSMDDIDHITYDPIIARIREQLGEEAFRAEWEAGTQMSLKEAIDYAVRGIT
jgi:tetratricopeptide (TPR) repeat protein